ncbi:ADP-ribosyltransferase [Nocardia sp. NBC_00508]|uniref:hypothetical protein n=1 Tax=Nocardia sp. NBC_00508 TaxID=2975992 RepID=UPI002E7FB793|nr:hypothetical protein [Nocardia sp. NBC_00508]WUD64354.1 ADP-ribosyltransferase [Nocardia sp. NBC_00508]
MSVLGIDPQVYYSTAAGLQDAATKWFSAMDARHGALSECASMAGSYEEARGWAAQYDDVASSVLREGARIAEAAGNFASVVQTVGHNYALAEHSATINAGGPGPEKPAPFPPPVYLCRVPLPSAGGPGNGLVSDSVELIEMIGVTVPDGDTDKLQNVSDAWKQIQTDPAIADFPAFLDQIAAELERNIAPEIPLVIKDLQILRDSSRDLIAAFAELSAACLDHKQSLTELRDKLMVLLQDLGKQIAAEVGITIALAVAASVLTAGLGAAVGSARVAQIIAKAAGPIRGLIDGWKAARKAKQVREFNSLANVAKRRADLDRIANMGKKATDTRPAQLSGRDVDTIADYTGSASDYANGALRRGNVTPEQQRYIDDLNRALDKLPDYRGPVTRVTNLEPEEIAAYRRAWERGEGHTDPAFTSTSPLTNGGGVRDGNVEFQIFSQTGKDITQYSAPGNPEILFKSGTPFKPTNIFTDWTTGRTVIQMTEVLK